MAERKVYTPREAAEKLGISVAMLRYLRVTGRVQGTNVGNTTLYTEEQLSKADLSPRKTGPKPPGARQKKSDEVGAAA